MGESTSNVLVSVVLGNYNGAKFLKETLVTVLTQDYDRYEVIVVDDASTDNSLELIREFENDPKLKILPQKVNGGQCSAFNIGVDNASGRWIAFMDSDDLWMKNKLSEVAAVISVIDEEKVSIIQHNLYFMRNDTATKTLFRRQLESGNRYEELKLKRQIIPFVPTAGLIFNAKLLKKCLPVPSSFRVCADGFLTRTAMLHGETVSIDKPLGYYRVHSENNTFANEKFSRDNYVQKILLPELERYYADQNVRFDFQELKMLDYGNYLHFDKLKKFGIKNTFKLLVKLILVKLVNSYHFLPRGKKLFGLANRAKIIDLRNIHWDQRAFVVGMGPSLKIEDLNKLKNEITYGCNKVYLSFDETEWRPTYYSVIDILVAQNNKEKIKNLKLNKIFSESIKDEFTDYDITWIKQLPSIEKDNGERFFNVSSNLLSGAYGGFSVTYFQIQLAIYMGISEIYLIGMDFDYNFSKNTMTGEISKHGEVLKSDAELNHFHPDYRLKGETWTYPNVEMIEKGFEALNSYAKENGIKIYNASRTTKLDVFERVDFDSLF